jgi:alpha-tubulin suppressor-like RCC1 family protein
VLVAALAVTPVAAAGSERAVAPTGAARAVAVTAGVAHTCALTRAGGVKCWGYNGHDELGTGNPDLQDSLVPVDVSDLHSGVTAISAGVRHSCAVTGAGGVKCWGAAYSGALGDGTTERHWAPVDVAGLHSGVTAVSAGYDYSCALTTSGGVKCWGSNVHGQLGDGTTADRWAPVDVPGLSGVTAVAAGVFTTCAVMATGGVKCWGFRYGTAPAAVHGLSGVTAITTGGPLCALTASGGVKCWSGDYGPTPIEVPGLSGGVTAISANGGHACAIASGGGVKCWGLNDYGQLGDGTRVNRPTPVAVSGLRAGATAIATGGFHTCAVTSGGNVKCWGGPGALGDGTNHIRLKPVWVVGFAPKASLVILSRTVVVSQARVAPLELRCAGALCKGTLTLGNLGSRRFSLGAGHTRFVRVRLNARGFSRLVRVGRLSVRARARYGSSFTARTITLHRPK